MNNKVEMKAWEAKYKIEKTYSNTSLKNFNTEVSSLFYHTWLKISLYWGSGAFSWSLIWELHWIYCNCLFYQIQGNRDIKDKPLTISMQEFISHIKRLLIFTHLGSGSHSFCLLYETVRQHAVTHVTSLHPTLEKEATEITNNSLFTQLVTPLKMHILFWSSKSL